MIILIVVGVSIILLALSNRWLPKWFCKLDWHLPPKSQTFDGGSLGGVCPRCGQHILQDSQGNWFST